MIVNIPFWSNETLMLESQVLPSISADIFVEELDPSLLHEANETVNNAIQINFAKNFMLKKV